MLFDDHHHFFQGGITGSFTKSVDGTFYLAGPGDNAGNGIGGCQAEVIMAMTGNNRFVNIADVINEIGNFFTVLMWAGNNQWYPEYLQQWRRL